MPAYRRNPQVEEAPLKEELLLFNPATSQFYLLNGTMAHIWRSCEEVRSVDGLISTIGEAFEGANDSAAAEDVRKAVEELLSMGLIVDEPTTAG